MCLLFFFSSRRRHTRFKCDWSSDVCSSDLEVGLRRRVLEAQLVELQLHELGFEHSPSEANFVFVKTTGGNVAAAVSDALRERRILVRHYDRDPIAGWFRITVGTREQHERLLEALKKILILALRLQTKPRRSSLRSRNQTGGAGTS